MSFHDFKPVDVTPEPEPVTTKVYEIEVRRVFEWTLTIRAASEEEARTIAYDLTQYDSTGYVDVHVDVNDEVDDNGQEVDNE